MKTDPPCLTSMSPLWRLSDWLSRGLCPRKVGRTFSSPHLPGPLYHTHAAPPHPGHVLPSHMEAFKVPSAHGLLWASCLESSKRNQLQLVISYPNLMWVHLKETLALCVHPPAPNFLSISPNSASLAPLLPIKIFSKSQNTSSIAPLYQDFISVEIYEFIYIKALYKMY